VIQDFMALIVRKGVGIVSNTPVTWSPENVSRVLITTLVLNVTYVRQPFFFLNTASKFFSLTALVPVFSEPPVVSDVEYSEAKVQVENFELADKNYKHPPDFYYVEYRVGCLFSLFLTFYIFYLIL
jgi:hypothetical protein